MDSRANESKRSKHTQLRGDIFLKESSTHGFSGDLDDDNINALLFISVILGTLSLLRNNRLPQGTNWNAGPLFFGANHLAESWQWVITAILKTAALAVSKYYSLLMNGPIDLQSYSASVCDTHARPISNNVRWVIYPCTDKNPQSNRAEDGNFSTLVLIIMLQQGLYWCNCMVSWKSQIFQQ